MRHAVRSQRLSRPSDHRAAMVHTLVKNLIVHGQIQTTVARAKEAQRLADRLITMGKDGSVHARRRAFQILQNRTLVKQLFADLAPRFLDVGGGYTRVIRTSFRRGDGAQRAMLAFSRLPAVQPPAPAAGPKGAPKPSAPPAPSRPKPEEPKAKKPKGLLEGLRHLWKKKGSAAAA